MNTRIETIWRDLSPFAVGFDRTFDTLSILANSKAQNTNYPPYNIRKLPEDKYSIELAVAGFDEKDIIIPQDTMNCIITNYTDNEAGVRNLKRCLETIYTKLNLFRLLTPNTNLFETMCKLGMITYPYTVTVDVVHILLPLKTEGSKWNAMYL